MTTIRPERPGDTESVRALHLEAFDSSAEADLVDLLREGCEEYLAFVAVSGGDVIGHILFTPVTLDGSSLVGMGLAPMAVGRRFQKGGIGSRLVRHGLRHLQACGYPFVLVVGHPEYYPRFGFGPAKRHGLVCQWDGVPDDAFMILVFDGSVFPRDGGTVRYRDEFDSAM